jgi:hypothetical protein
VLTKYPSPATALKEAVFTVCQLSSTPTDEEPPNEIVVPLIVIVELESLALAIVVLLIDR